jgi:RimJ/RimL family protein N-acetyltransferase
MSRVSRDVVIEDDRITTSRLSLRRWQPEDADAALAIYGTSEVAKWLAPAMTQVPDASAMRALLSRWVAASAELQPPASRWAIERRDDRSLIGGAALLPLPPDGIDLEIGWQLTPAAWGHGFGGEAGHAVAHYAFVSGVDELFAVVRPRNVRGGRTAERIGMQWVGETEKYYDLRLQVYRLRKADLDLPDIVTDMSDLLS